MLSLGDGWPLSTVLVGKLYPIVPRMLGMYVYNTEQRMCFKFCVLSARVVSSVEIIKATWSKPEPVLQKEKRNYIVCDDVFCLLWC